MRLFGAMRALIAALALLLLAACCVEAGAAKERPTFGIQDDKLILDGKPVQIISGRCV